MRGGFTYILAGESGVLYTGVTSRIDLRMLTHRKRQQDGFTKKYNVTKLVYFERFSDIRLAIAREKEIKGWLRRKKVVLIEEQNPGWKDLTETLFPYPHWDA